MDSQSRRVSRREFAGIVAASVAAVPAVSGAQSPPPLVPAQLRTDYVPPRGVAIADDPPFADALAFTSAPVRPRGEAFALHEVRLLPDSPFHRAREWNRGFMSRLSADRLLYGFRLNAGLPVGAAASYGGWEQADPSHEPSELRGHFVGHFLSASALLFASTGDTDAKSKADYIVSELAKCQQRLGGSYLSAFPTTWFDRLEAGKRVWAPFYTIHKILAGLLDMHQLAGNAQALQVLEGMAAWVDRWTARFTLPQMQQVLRKEFGGIAETLYNLAAATGDARWATAGDRFQKRAFINPLGMGRDDLAGLHVNTHIPQVIAAARRYEISGDPRFRQVADFFFHQVTTARSYVTGGTSNAEAWLQPPNRLAAELTESVRTAECCCAYNMLKLARHLYTWSPDSRYFDYYERVLLNHRIGTIRPELGTTQYYLSLAPGAWRTFASEDHSFWCCTGTGVEEYAKLNDSIYWRDDQGLYVNLFIPSELEWKERGLTLRQETRYPDEERTALVVTAAPSGPMTIRVRVPGWLASAPAVTLNGRRLEATASPGSYLAMTRTWQSGDRLELELPMELRVETMPDDPAVQAFLVGPLVLAADLGNEGLSDAQIVGANVTVGAPRDPGAPSKEGQPPDRGVQLPTLKRGEKDLASLVRGGDAPHTFSVEGQETAVRLVPFNTVIDRRYHVYWRIV